jgi:hypothetical protein
MYSITSVHTFIEAQTFYEQILYSKGRDKVPLVLVG